MIGETPLKLLQKPDIMRAMQKYRFQNAIRPHPETNALRGLYTIANREDHIERVMFYPIGLTVRGSCRKFCDNWKTFQFLFKRIRNMFADCLYIPAKEHCKLITIKPNSVDIRKGIDSDSISTSIDNCLIFV